LQIICPHYVVKKCVIFFEKSKKVHFLREKYRIIRFSHVKIQTNLLKIQQKVSFATFLDSVLSFKSSKFFILKQKSALKRILTTYNIKILREYQAYFEDIHVISN